MTKKEIAKRYILFIISLFFSGVGVAFTKSGGLGVSPISSLANVLSIRFDEISIGTWLILTNFILVMAQIAILRKDFQPVQLLQIPLSALFGYFTDFGMLIAGLVPVNSHIMQLVMVVIGTAILGIGIALAVIANVIMNAGEAFVRAVADKLNKNFGNVKVVFDVSYVTMSAIVSFILFGGSVQGIREGTLIAAVLTGFMVKIFTKPLMAPISKLLK